MSPLINTRDPADPADSLEKKHMRGRTCYPNYLLYGSISGVRGIRGETVIQLDFDGQALEALTW
jgi:hypothetical protein